MSQIPTTPMAKVISGPTTRRSVASVEAPADIYSPGIGSLGLMKPDFSLMAKSTTREPDGPRPESWPTPAADAKGDYRVRTYFDRWQVTDPQGLNVRMPAGFPVDYDSVNANWPTKPDLSSDNTKVGAFATGTKLTPVMGNLGILYLNDANGAPWMMVRGEDETGGPLTGFVRSNMKHIQPERENGPIPVADAKGDFRTRSLYDKWEVSDPTGLNVRMPAGFPLNYDSMNANWPTKPDLSSDDTKVGAFASGAKLTPVMGNLGILYLDDANGAPWMMVRGEDETGGPLTGFVRSNQKHIRPRQD